MQKHYFRRALRGYLLLASLSASVLMPTNVLSGTAGSAGTTLHGSTSIRSRSEMTSYGSRQKWSTNRQIRKHAYRDGNEANKYDSEDSGSTVYATNDVGTRQEVDAAATTEDDAIPQVTMPYITTRRIDSDGKRRYSAFKREVTATGVVNRKVDVYRVYDSYTGDSTAVDGMLSQVLGLGLNRKGRLGLRFFVNTPPSGITTYLVPTPLTLSNALPPVYRMAFTPEHTVMLSASSNIFTAGDSNAVGQQLTTSEVSEDPAPDIVSMLTLAGGIAENATLMQVGSSRLYPIDVSSSARLVQLYDGFGKSWPVWEDGTNYDVVAVNGAVQLGAEHVYGPPVVYRNGVSAVSTLTGVAVTSLPEKNDYVTQRLPKFIKVTASNTFVAAIADNGCWFLSSDSGVNFAQQTCAAAPSFYTDIALGSSGPGTYFVMITDSNRILTVHGQALLSDGSTMTMNTTASDIKEICAGPAWGAYLKAGTAGSGIYTAGASDVAQAGAQMVSKNWSLILPGNFRKLSCGTLHGLAVSNTGEVFGWGSNAFGALGPQAISVLGKSSYPAWTATGSYSAGDIVSHNGTRWRYPKIPLAFDSSQTKLHGSNSTYITVGGGPLINPTYILRASGSEDILGNLPAPRTISIPSDIFNYPPGEYAAHRPDLEWNAGTTYLPGDVVWVDTGYGRVAWFMSNYRYVECCGCSCEDGAGTLINVNCATGNMTQNPMCKCDIVGRNPISPYNPGTICDAPAAYWTPIRQLGWESLDDIWMTSSNGSESTEPTPMYHDLEVVTYREQMYELILPPSSDTRWSLVSGEVAEHNVTADKLRSLQTLDPATNWRVLRDSAHNSIYSMPQNVIEAQPLGIHAFLAFAGNNVSFFIK